MPPLLHAVQMLSMKMIASRELSARPGSVWADLALEGAVVVTRDGLPMGIITPASPATLLEDMQEIAFAKARHAVAGNRKHFPPAGRGPVRVLTPAEAWAEFER
ncbi:MAG: hypothetical protein M0Q93_05445 [Terrimicrobiaceae bacterium]|nr:hypothetical protein [Terrimicrobiaceae bacterium]